MLRTSPPRSRNPRQPRYSGAFHVWSLPIAGSKRWIRLSQMSIHHRTLASGSHSVPSPRLAPASRTQAISTIDRFPTLRAEDRTHNARAHCGVIVIVKEVANDAIGTEYEDAVGDPHDLGHVGRDH